MAELSAVAVLVLGPPARAADAPLPAAPDPGGARRHPDRAGQPRRRLPRRRAARARRPRRGRRHRPHRQAPRAHHLPDHRRRPRRVRRAAGQPARRRAPGLPAVLRRARRGQRAARATSSSSSSRGGATARRATWPAWRRPTGLSGTWACPGGTSSTSSTTSPLLRAEIAWLDAHARRAARRRPRLGRPVPARRSSRPSAPSTSSSLPPDTHEGQLMSTTTEQPARSSTSTAAVRGASCPPSASASS